MKVLQKQDEELKRIRELNERAKAFLQEASVCIDEMNLRLNKILNEKKKV